MLGSERRGPGLDDCTLDGGGTGAGSAERLESGRALNVHRERLRSFRRSRRCWTPCTRRPQSVPHRHKRLLYGANHVMPNRHADESSAVERRARPRNWENPTDRRPTPVRGLGSAARCDPLAAVASARTTRKIRVSSVGWTGRRRRARPAGARLVG